MKILRFVDGEGRVQTGVRETDGRIELLEGGLLERPRRTGRWCAAAAVSRFLPPVDPPNIVAIGKNYREHANELGLGVAAAPLLFLKATTCLAAHGEAIRLPREAPEAVDFEAELVVVIGREARRVAPERAAEYVLGYTCGNDVTARDCQGEDGQWARAKSFDTFGPVGPEVETELPAGGLRIRSMLRGRVMQDSSTADMLFPVEEIVSYVSRHLTLLPGTLIFTGTPPGIGGARKPAVFLRPGDTIAVEIEGIGRLENPVQAE